MTPFEIADLSGLQRFADALARSLPTGVTIGLVGTLGAGKTSLTQALARAIEIDAADVTSPTFTLLQTHHGNHPTGRPVTLNHLDAYRIADEDEFIELGVDELFDDAEAWTIIEWADRVRGCLPADTLWLTITLVANADARRIVASTTNTELSDMVKALGRVVDADGTD